MKDSDLSQILQKAKLLKELPTLLVRRRLTMRASHRAAAPLVCYFFDSREGISLKAVVDSKGLRFGMGLKT